MKKYDLEERTLGFSRDLIVSLKKIQRTIYNEKLIKQVIGSGTSIGANYREANGAESKKDFRHKIRISLKESRETKYWLKLLMASEASEVSDLRKLFDEVHEFSLIFGKISSTCDSN